MTENTQIKLSSNVACYASFELSDDDIDALELDFPRTIKRDDRDDFLRAIKGLVKMWVSLEQSNRIQEIKNAKTNRNGRTPPIRADTPVLMAQAEKVKRMLAFEEAIDALKKAIVGLENQPFAAMAPQFRYLARASNPPKPLPEKWRNSNSKLEPVLLDLVSSLNGLYVVSESTRSILTVRKNSQPSKARARGFANMIVDAHLYKFGKLPSGSKDHWFTKFLGTLCGRMPTLDTYGRDISVKVGRDMLGTLIADRTAKQPD